MARPKKNKEEVSITDDHKMKSMILPLEPNLHSFVKKIAEAADMAQPLVVRFVLEKNKHAVDDYIKELKQERNEKERKELEAKKAQIEKQIEKLTSQE